MRTIKMKDGRYSCGICMAENCTNVTWPMSAWLADPRPASEVDPDDHQINTHYTAKICWPCGIRLQAEGIEIDFHYRMHTWEEKLAVLEELQEAKHTLKTLMRSAGINTILVLRKMRSTPRI